MEDGRALRMGDPRVIRRKDRSEDRRADAQIHTEWKTVTEYDR